MKRPYNLPKVILLFYDCLHRKEKETERDKMLQTAMKKELQELKWELDLARDRFDNETDLDLIDAHIWELKAIEVRYEQAIKKAKQFHNTHPAGKSYSS